MSIIDIREHINKKQRNRLIEIVINDYRKHAGEKYSIQGENELYRRLNNLTKAELIHLKNKAEARNISLD